jgi:hypothetical protein
VSITEQGREGEILAMKYLKSKCKCEIFQADWLAYKNGKYYVIEVKYKELYKSPPFDGQGLNVRQVVSRMKFFQDTSIRCYFLCITKPDNQVIGQWLDILESGRKFDTRNNIRIYDIAGFQRLGKI